MRKITIVTAFFDIGREDFTDTSYARNNETYMNYFEFWARIKNQMVIYTDQNSVEKIQKIRNKFGLKKETIIIPIDNIYEIEPNIYRRILKIEKCNTLNEFKYYDNAMSYKASYNYIMMLKYWCLKDAAERGLASDTLAWIDFGFNHGGKCYTVKEEFNFIWEYDFEDFIYLFCKKDPKEVSSALSLQLMFDTVMGCLIIVPSKNSKELWELIKKAMEALLMLDCIDDDQQLLLMAYKAKPELFKIEISDWFMPLKEYGGVHLTIKEQTHKQVNEQQTYINKIKSRVRRIIRGQKSNNKRFAKKMYNNALKYYRE